MRDKPCSRRYLDVCFASSVTAYFQVTAARHYREVHAAAGTDVGGVQLTVAVAAVGETETANSVLCASTRCGLEGHEEPDVISVAGETHRCGIRVGRGDVLVFS